MEDVIARADEMLAEARRCGGTASAGRADARRPAGLTLVRLAYRLPDPGVVPMLGSKPRCCALRRMRQSA
jgi:hypothetical protein